MDKLESCPFCGGEARFWTKGGRFGYFAWVECDICGGRTKTVSSEFEVNDERYMQSTQTQVLKAAWNRRVDNA